MKETITAIRAVRKEKQISARNQVELVIKTDKNSYDKEFLPVIIKLANLSGIRFVTEKQTGIAAFMVRTTEYLIPVGEEVDTENERKKVAADLKYYKGFLESVMKKLNNERFVQNAPPSVLELERKKKADTELIIRSLEESLKTLSEQKKKS